MFGLIGLALVASVMSCGGGSSGSGSSTSGNGNPGTPSGNYQGVEVSVAINNIPQSVYLTVNVQ
jgi:hypothetical protein